MKNRIIALFSTLLCLIVTGASAQWRIEINGGTSTTLCQQLTTGNVVVRVYNGVTNMTASCWVYENIASGAISPTGAFEPQGYIVQSPTYTPAHGTGAYYGPVTLTAYNGDPGAGGVLVATYALNIVPNGQVLTGAVSGPSSINTSGVFTLNTGVQFVSTTNLNWYISNGNFNAYYTGVASGSTYTVTPLPYAPLFTSGIVSASFEPSTGSCGTNSGVTSSFGRNPVISSSLPYNIFCGGSTVLTSNMQDNPWYPSDPVLQMLAHRGDAHLVMQWYSTATGTTVLGTGPTYTATSAGTYYMVVTQYNLEQVGTNWQFSTTAAGTKTSNSITITNPVAGTLAPTFKVNGQSPTATQTGSTPAFFACQGNTILFNGSGSAGPVHDYAIQVNGTTVSTGVGAPPSSLDLSTFFATSGFYLIKLTISNGCTSTFYQGYIKVNVSAPPSGSISVNTTLIAGNTTTTYGGSTGLTSATPIHVGRYTTTFYETPSYGTTSAACSYQVNLYKVVSGVNTLISSGTPTALSCTTASLPIMNISALNASGGVPYFVSTTNAPNNTEWAVDFILTNECGSTHNMKYFLLDDATYFKGANNTTSAMGSDDGVIGLSPVPFRNELNANLTLQDDATTSLMIISVDGRSVIKAWENESMSKGVVRKTINTADWAPGIYFYKFITDGKSYSGKIVKE